MRKIYENYTFKFKNMQNIYIIGDGKKTALIQIISYYVSIFVIFNLKIKNNKT